MARSRVFGHNRDAPTQLKRKNPAPRTAAVVQRLLALGWAYRRRCLQVLGYQVVLPRDAVCGLPAAYADALIDNTLSLLATITSVDDLVAAWAPSPEDAP